MLKSAVDHRWLATFLEYRIADQRVLRLIGKWLSAGVIHPDKTRLIEFG